MYQFSIAVTDDCTPVADAVYGSDGKSKFVPNRRQSKTLLTIDERGSKSPETVFSIAICRQSPQNSGSESPWRERDLSPTWNLEIKS